MAKGKGKGGSRGGRTYVRDAKGRFASKGGGSARSRGSAKKMGKAIPADRETQLYRRSARLIDKVTDLTRKGRKLALNAAKGKDSSRNRNAFVRNTDQLRKAKRALQTSDRQLVNYRKRMSGSAKKTGRVAANFGDGKRASRRDAALVSNRMAGNASPKRSGVKSSATAMNRGMRSKAAAKVSATAKTTQWKWHGLSNRSKAASKMSATAKPTPTRTKAKAAKMSATAKANTARNKRRAAGYKAAATRKRNAAAKKR